MGPDGMSMVNGTTGVHGEEYWTDGGTMSVSQVRPSSPQTQAQGPPQAQPQRQVSDVYSNTLPVRRPAPAKNKNPVGKVSQHCSDLMSSYHCSCSRKITSRIFDCMSTPLTSFYFKVFSGTVHVCWCYTKAQLRNC